MGILSESSQGEKRKAEHTNRQNANNEKNKFSKSKKGFDSNINKKRKGSMGDQILAIVDSSDPDSDDNFLNSIAEAMTFEVNSAKSRTNEKFPVPEKAKQANSFEKIKKLGELSSQISLNIGNDADHSFISEENSSVISIDNAIAKSTTETINRLRSLEKEFIMAINEGISIIESFDQVISSNEKLLQDQANTLDDQYGELSKKWDSIKTGASSLLNLTNFGT
ncbi:hypothetical protein AYI70_g4127 [Smittium culicis]|uniref:Uncharacterized protein n=1 Tax=Smittium culicis TaxID=133412 RepID=A0A1R1Y0E6_9FUNG|nr:hypothetical protein AYI70_g4127 [Smittium culicis]